MWHVVNGEQSLQRIQDRLQELGLQVPSFLGSGKGALWGTNLGAKAHGIFGENILSHHLSPSRVTQAQNSLGPVNLRHSSPAAHTWAPLLGSPVSPPAVNDNGPGIRWSGSLHTPDEGQQPRGVVGDTMLWPCCEVELVDLMPG